VARLYGVQTGYRANDGRRHVADDDVLVAVLGALGAPLARLDDAPDALRAAHERARRRVIEPVIAHRVGGSVTTVVTLPARVDPNTVWVSLEREDGDVDRRRLATVPARSAPSPALATMGAMPVDGGEPVRHHSFRLRRAGLPPGYHRILVEGPGVEAAALVISAPVRLPPVRRQWGLGIPLYALRTRADWGVGSYGDLATFASWAGDMGAALAGTLPLYATFLDPPGADPSPYLPASRLAWNEVYLDVDSLPELDLVPEVRDELRSPELRDHLFRLRRSPLAHPSASLALKRRLVEPLARALAVQDVRRSARRAEWASWAAGHPQAFAYARFRAARERLGASWATWPGHEVTTVRATAGTGGTTDADTVWRTVVGDPATAYHLYAQWVADSQLSAAVDGPGAPAGLYLDVPVGVHPDGFDPFVEPAVFVHGLSAGAPPDAFFAGGQTWGFPPLHPDGDRAQGYRHLIAVLRTAMRHAAAVRIDHVMGLHRMYVVPPGGDAGQGVYLSYQGDEVHALVVLEACRSGTIVAGEDLGTVPTAVERAMARDRMLSAHVLEFESTVEEPLPPTPRRALASFATHDLPTFAGFWRSLDIGDRRRRDLLGAQDAARDRQDRARWRSALLAALPDRGLAVLPTDGTAAEERRALRGCLRHLAGGQAEVVMVDLEDLWLEPEPQNRPGTGPEAGNFRRRATRVLDDVVADAEVAVLLREIDARRRPELDVPVPEPAHPSGRGLDAESSARPSSASPAPTPAAPPPTPATPTHGKGAP
jgi:4-alpha-glucanotransferase